MEEIMTTPTTIARMRGNARRLDRLNIRVTTVLAAMRRGEALLMEFRWYGRAWSLSGGRSVPDDVATIVIKNKNIADVGDALFKDAKPQTWRWVGN
jgi:hypothetical protein